MLRAMDQPRALRGIEEQAVVGRILAKVRVDAAARVPDGPHGARRHAGQRDVLLHDQEGAQHQAGIALEGIVMDDVQALVQLAEIGVDDGGFVGRARKEALFDVLHQDHVQLRHLARGAVVALHEQFAGAAGGRILDAVCLRQARLQVEQQPVFSPVGEQMQFDAQALERLLGAAQRARLGRREQACLGDLAPAAAEVGRAGHPQNHLQIAQAAGRLLAVRFQRIGGFLVAGVALLQFDALGQKEGARIQAAVHGRHEPPEQAAAAGQPARLEQSGFHRNVGAGFAFAVFDGAHAVAGFETQIPERGDQPLDGGFVGRRRRLRQQDEQVDIGVRKEVAAAVSAHRRQGGSLGERAQCQQVAQSPVDVAAQIGQKRVGAAVVVEPGDGGGACSLHPGLDLGKLGEAHANGRDGVRRGRERPAVR